MPVSSLRSVLPAATSVVAALWLAGAMPHGLVPEVAAAGLALDAGAQAVGKAPVERAEWLAHDDAPSRQASRQ